MSGARLDLPLLPKHVVNVLDMEIGGVRLAGAENTTFFRPTPVKKDIRNSFGRRKKNIEVVTSFAEYINTLCWRPLLVTRYVIHGP